MAVPLERTRTFFAALPDHRQGLLAMLGAAVLWSTGGLFIKAVSLDAFGVTMWRSLLAGVAIAVVMRVRPFTPWREGWITWGAAISYAAMLLLFVSATKLTTAANAIFLQYTAPRPRRPPPQRTPHPPGRRNRARGLRWHGPLLRRPARCQRPWWERSGHRLGHRLRQLPRLPPPPRLRP
ncbi:MAG: DMT family transporter [Dehalococcoidia bacterium]